MLMGQEKMESLFYHSLVFWLGTRPHTETSVQACISDAAVLAFKVFCVPWDLFGIRPPLHQVHGSVFAESPEISGARSENRLPGPWQPGWQTPLLRVQGGFYIYS